jgi:hypothetical protein
MSVRLPRDAAGGVDAIEAVAAVAASRSTATWTVCGPTDALRALPGWRRTASTTSPAPGQYIAYDASDIDLEEARSPT